MNKKQVLRILLVVFLVALAGVAAWWFYVGLNPPDKNQLLLYGNIDIREADLAFNNSEHVDELLVQEGDRVHKGQLLATLHRKRFEADVANAEAKLASQHAVVARLETGSRPEEVRQARAEVAAARAGLQDAEVTFKRIQRLSETDVVSKQVMDDARTTMDTARANLSVAQEALALAVEGPRVEDIAAARATLNAYEAQLELAEEVLKDTALYAPSDGVIRNRILEPGDMVSPQVPVFTLALTNPVWVRTYVPESSLGRITQGMSAEVATDSFPGKTYQGWIGFVSPTAEFTPKNVETPELRTRLVYQMRIYVCNPQDELHLGMPATVSILLDQPKPEPGQSTPDCAEQKVE